MNIPVRPEGGRYPNGMLYNVETICVKAYVLGDRLVIRIDDSVRIDRWEELSINLADLKELVNG